MNRSDFQKLTEIRMKEAKVLLSNACFEGAYYLAGYAVECAIKACIAKKTQIHDFPPEWQVVRNCYTHDITSLAKLADLELELKSQEEAVVQFKLNWAIVKDWSERKRYETRIDSNRARDLYRAISHYRNGVLPWLKKYW
jgi:HEPN domain-containing protein